MIGRWMPGSGDFVNALRQRMERIGGELFLVATTEIPVSSAIPTFETVEEALVAAKALRKERREASLQVAV